MYSKKIALLGMMCCFASSVFSMKDVKTKFKPKYTMCLSPDKNQLTASELDFSGPTMKRTEVYMNLETDKKFFRCTKTKLREGLPYYVPTEESPSTIKFLNLLLEKFLVKNPKKSLMSLDPDKIESALESFNKKDIPLIRNKFLKGKIKVNSKLNFPEPENTPGILVMINGILIYQIEEKEKKFDGSTLDKIGKFLGLLSGNKKK